MLDRWLALALEGREPQSATGPLPGGRYRLLGPGIVELVPATPEEAAVACVLSVGIHGNETAPIELLGESLERLEAGLIRLGAPVLVILGNPEAIRRERRHVAANLNRLFRRDLEEGGAEPDRARELMAELDTFYARHPNRARLHYDLHTAIRDSRYPRFAVEPFAESRTPAEQWGWLSAAGIQAVLHQHRHSWTFSHYSKHYHATPAFTIELGRALPFGHNDLAPLAPMGRLIEALIEGREPASADPATMAFFRVEHELIRGTEDFRLCFGEQTANFTEFTPGEPLAEEEGKAFTVGEEPVGVVFPNAEVEIGARAALLVTRTSPPTAS